MNVIGHRTLPQFFEVLQRFQDDPTALEQAREQYSDSPPPYSSGEATQPPSPEPILSEADRRFQRRHEREQSIPFWQFDYQWRRERERILEQIRRRYERRKETLPYDNNLDFITNARNNIKNRWIDQGIWKDGWTTYTVGAHWKHEEPLPPLPQSTSDTEAPIPNLFGEKGSKKQPTQGESPEFTEGERKAIHDKESTASRPYHQFLYQVAREREWLEDEHNGGVADLDLQAYRDVRSSWEKQRIWDPKWPDMPGDKWMHEEPDDEPEFMPAPADTSTDGSQSNTEVNTVPTHIPHKPHPTSSGDMSQDQINENLDREQPEVTRCLRSFQNHVEIKIDRGAADDGSLKDAGVDTSDPRTQVAKRTDLRLEVPTAIPTAQSGRKRKRNGGDEVCHNNKPPKKGVSLHMAPRQSKRLPSALLTDGHSADLSLAHVPTKESPRKAVHSQQSSYGAAAEPGQPGSQLQGRRRSLRIRNRIGTEKSTIYDFDNSDWYQENKRVTGQQATKPTHSRYHKPPI